MLSTDRIGVVLVNAVKEQQTEIELQRQQIDQQSQRIEQQDRTIDAL